MDLQEVLKVLELMEKHGLDEIEVEQEGMRVRLKKNTIMPMMAGQVIPAPLMAAPSPMAMPASPVPGAPTQPAESEKDIIKIMSPMVGTFYRSPSPDAESFVNPGDHVHPDKVVCIIEAMKVMNEIKAEVEGELVSILVENGESVEYGQPLFAIRRANPSK